jgi:chemotaxis protein CheC
MNVDFENKLPSHDYASWNAIFAPAAESASRALARWTHGRVKLELDHVRECEMHELASSLPADDAPSIMVSVGIAGDEGGQLVLIFQEESARALVACLLNRTAKELGAWGELEWSALKETGNICSSAFLSAIRPFVGEAVLLPAPPTILQDYVTCVIEQAIMPQLVASDTLLLCRTRMIHEGKAIAFSSLFVPTPQLVDALRRFISSSLTLT